MEIILLDKLRRMCYIYLGDSVKFENMKIKDIKAVVKYRSTGKGWSAVNRKDHIIGIAFSGDEIHDLGYQSFSIGEGCIYFLNQRDDFLVRVNENALSHSVHFTTDEDIDTDSFCIKLNGIGELANLLERIDREMRLGVNKMHMLYSDVYKLFSLFGDMYKKRYSHFDPRIITAVEYLDIHFCESDCLKRMYAASVLSRRHFDQLFKENFKITPNRYVTQRKVEMAKSLLTSVNLNLEEIASLCGFSDVYYFSKVFKGETGLTPSSYRRTSFE